MKTAPLWKYLSEAQQLYVERGFEDAFGDPPVVPRRQVPIGLFSVDGRALSAARWDNLHGRPSRTTGPVRLRYDPSRDVFFLVDGHHRLTAAIESKRRSIGVVIVGAGYSDYWATPV
jgi:hypothetical protein